MASSKAHAHVVAAGINAQFSINKTMGRGMAVMHNEGSRLTAPAPQTDSPFTWGATAEGPFAAMPSESFKAYMGFKPTAHDLVAAEALQTTTLDRAAVTPFLHSSVKEAVAQARAGASHASHGANNTNFMTLGLAAVKSTMGLHPSAQDRLTAEEFHKASLSPSPSFGVGAQSQPSLPKHFDWRHHTKCIGPVRNQSRCGSCWAVSSAGAASDRACMVCENSGKPLDQCKMPYAAQTMVSCAVAPGTGCNGSNLSTPYAYMATTGIPPLAQAPYQSGGGQVPPCPSGLPGPFLHSAALDQSIGLTQTSASDPFRILPVAASGDTTDVIGSRGLSRLARTIEGMKREIMTNGPITGGMTVFSDFQVFNGEGVYQPVPQSVYDAHGIPFKQTVLGGHALEIIGWGVDHEHGSHLPYWLVKNSWGTTWPAGDRKPGSTAGTGYFKMIMYDGTKPSPTQDEIVPEASSDAALTFEATAHAALFPNPPPVSTHVAPPSSGQPWGPSFMPPSFMPPMGPLSPANPLPFDPL